MYAQDDAALYDTPPVGAALYAAAEVHDHLLIAGHDLQRLQRLLENASQTLLRQFGRAIDGVDAGSPHEARQALAGAVTALQFQDLAAQLIGHTARRLRSCADRIASRAMGDDDEPAVVEEAPSHPNPVTQDEMDTGSIELF